MNTDGLRPEIKRLRLACAMPNPEDGTSYHRALGPLAVMSRQDPRLELQLPQHSRVGRGWNLGWDWVAPADAVLIQRPFLPVHVQFCRQVKAMERKLWVEWDDLLWDIPLSNPSYEPYRDIKSVKECMEAIYELADFVTTATVPLARILGPKARVIPNAMHMKFYDEPRRRIVAWRGSASHDEDVCTVLEKIKVLSSKPQHSRWKWHFSGGVPWQVRGAIPAGQFEESPGTGPVFFVPFLGLVAPYVLIAPLVTNRFNRCKSNLAWIEATCAGAVVLAPDMDEWRRPGVITYSDAIDFGDKLEELLHSFNGNQHPNVAVSREFIREHLTLPVVNRARWEILNEMV